MAEVYRMESPSGAKAVWLWALLGSLAIHLTLLAAALSWKTPLPPRARRVVPVEAVTLARFKAQPAGGGHPAPAAQTSAPAPLPVQSAKPRPKAKSKPPASQPAKKAVALEMAEMPAPTPLPPALSLPKPASSSGAPASGSSTAGHARPGSSEPRQGGGSGGGSGSGSGLDRGPGQGTGSLLQGYLREVRRLLERQKEYPHMAQRLNLQGVAVLQFSIAADGQVEALNLCQSSGHEILDKAAQETVRRVGRFPPLPADLGRQRLTVEIPLAFRLRN